MDRGPIFHDLYPVTHVSDGEKQGDCSDDGENRVISEFVETILNNLIPQR
jgi:hypothetical protein